MQMAADTRRRELKEATAVLSLWSILIANDGVVRFIQHGQLSAPGLFSSSSPNRCCGLFLGGIFEVILGLFGLLVGLSVGVLDYDNQTLAVALVAMQSNMG